jgi:excisionase family DNA binding protein
MLDFLSQLSYSSDKTIVAYCNAKGGDKVRDQKIAYSIEEASALSGIGRNTIRRLVEWGKLPVLKVGRKILIRSDSLDKFISTNEDRDLLIKDEVKAVGANVSV